MLRANIDPARVSVIPNAVDTSVFTPDPAGARAGDEAARILSGSAKRGTRGDGASEGSPSALSPGPMDSVLRYPRPS